MTVAACGGGGSPSASSNAALALRGLLGVAIFALTLPMTRMAVGPAEAPQLPPLFVTAGRAGFAGLLSIVYLLAVRAVAAQLA